MSFPHIQSRIMIANPQQAGPVLVLGGTGKTGSRVAQRLAAQGHAVRLGSRRGAPPFDWQRPEGWTAALHGAAAAYIAYQPDLAAPGAKAAVRDFVGQALANGVRRLVLLTGRGEPQAQAAERAFQELAGRAGADWTVLRASWFAQNFSESLLLPAVLGGEVALPAGDTGEPFVDAGDIADIAVAALTGDGHAGRVYDVTGPRLLSFAEAVAEIARARGRPLRYTRLDPAGYADLLRWHQVPEAEVELLLTLFGTLLDGRNAHLGDGVQQALGRPPRDFADYAQETASAGIWSVAA